MSEQWIIDRGFFCIDCGRLLRTLNEYKADLCSVCMNTTHIEYARDDHNARAAWEANKERHRKGQVVIESIKTIETMEPVARKFRIK